MSTSYIIPDKVEIEVSDGFKLFNVVTDNANAWSDMIKGKEDYNNGQVYVDEDDNIIDYYTTEEDGCFYGRAYLPETFKYTGHIHRYEPITVDTRKVITLEYVSSYLNDENINRNIAARIYCSETISKSINNHGHTVKNGINNVAYEMKKHR